MIYVPQKRVIQPQGVVEVDRSGIGNGLMVAFNAATPQINLANGKIETQGGGTGISNIVSADGKRIALSGSGTGKHTFPIYNETDEITLISVGSVTAADTLDRLYSNYNGAAATGRYDIYYDAVFALWHFQAFATTSNGIWRVTTPTVGSLNGVSVIRYKFGSTPRITVNNTEYSVEVVSALSGTQHAANGIATCFGRPDVTTRQPSGNFLCQYAWNRVLTDDEVKQVTANPWQIFAPIKRKIWVASAGGGTTTYTNTASLSAVIQQARTATASLSAAISQGKTGTSSLGAAIQTNRTASASAGMAIQQAFTASATLDAAIQRASTATASLDAYVVAAGSYTTTSSLSAAIQQARSATSSLGAAIANALSALAGVDAAISAGHTSSASLDTYVQVSGSGIITANLGAAIQQAQLAIATLDIAIRVARNASANLDLVVAIQGTTTSSIDLCISSNNTTTSGLDLLVLGSTQAYSSLNLYVYDGGTLTLSETDLDAIADRVWAKVLESTFSSSDILKIILAAVSGKSTGVGTSNEVYLSVDELTERINVTFDANNNRDIVNRDGT